MGWGGSYRGGWVIQGWGGSYRGGVVHTGWGGSYRSGGVGHRGVGWGGSYRGRKSNHKLRLESFYHLLKGRLSKGPHEIQGCCSRNVLGWGEIGHKNTEYHKKFAYVMLNWINFTNNYCIVDFYFLTLIYRQMTGQNEQTRTQICSKTQIIYHVAF